MSEIIYAYISSQSAESMNMPEIVCLTSIYIFKMHADVYKTSLLKEQGNVLINQLSVEV